MDFKERVKESAIQYSQTYKEVFVDYQYLICSEAFTARKYYIIDAKRDNYMHLLGIRSSLSPSSFFDKCINNELTLDDFDFENRGSVRRKINSLDSMMNIFQGHPYVEENFKKNTTICSFATSDNQCTLGFIAAGKSYPKTLMKSNMLDMKVAKPVSLVISKQSNESSFNKIIIGSHEELLKYKEALSSLDIDEHLWE